MTRERDGAAHRFPCFDLKGFPTFTVHLRMKPDSWEISRRGLVKSVVTSQDLLCNARSGALLQNAGVLTL